MDDLTHFFPNCKLSTTELREAIREAVQMTDGEDTFYFCYKCFAYVGVNNPKTPMCTNCYHFYCEKCAIPLLRYRTRDDSERTIDTKKCVYCSRN